MDAVVRAYDFSPFRMVVDVGGGYGALLATILSAPGGDGDKGDDGAETLVPIRGPDPRLDHGTGHAPGGRSAATAPLVWGAAPETACGLGVTALWRVAQACVNSAPKKKIRAE
jgi:O-methyltransferase domain